MPHPCHGRVTGPYGLRSRPHRVDQGAFRPPVPLRTVRDSFPSYGSSIPEGCPCGAPRLRAPVSRSLCDTHLQPSEFASGQVPIDLGPFRRVVSGCTGRSRLLLSHPRRFSRFSRNGTPVGRGHAFRRGRWSLSTFALSHVAGSILSISERRLLLPTSSCRPSIGLPYGRLARPRAWRTDGFSAFLTIASDNLGGTWTPVVLQSSCRDVRDLHLGHACKHWEACLRPLSSRRSERA